MRKSESTSADCGIAQALGVLGGWWTILILRDIAGEATRFDALQRGLGVSRRVLTERLASPVEHDVVCRRLYSQHPPRADYLLTVKGEALLSILVALQDWGTRHVMGDGSLTPLRCQRVRRSDASSTLLVGVFPRSPSPVTTGERNGWT